MQACLNGLYGNINWISKTKLLWAAEIKGSANKIQ